MTERENPYKKYLREDRLPHIFCPGCGNGIVMNSFFKGLEDSSIDFDNVVMVSGIGCSSRIPGYAKCDSLHTTHGRALSFATGLKVGNPDLDVVVFTGDGDAASIGGNHLIHAARRNIDLTVICINNNIYGMTGGQISPTSPLGSYGTTAPYGSNDVPFNLAKLVTGAGASYVAKWTTAHPNQMAKAIKNALEMEGFSFVEAVSQCPTYYGRKNKLKTPVQGMSYLKENSVTVRRAARMEDDELVGKIVVGEYENRPHHELCQGIKKLVDENSDCGLITRSAFREEF